MKDEIKGILDRLDYNEWEVNLYKVPITWCELYNIRDYITNLQEENEELKEENKRIFSKVNDDELLRSNAMNYAEAQKYKQRIDKAIEYINENGGFIFNEYEEIISNEVVAVESILEILEGKNNE